MIQHETKFVKAFTKTRRSNIINNMPKREFAQLFEHRYLEYQVERGGRATIEEFANWLGIARPTASNYINDKRQPTDEEEIKKLVLKLGPEVYDTLGLARPDPKLRQFIEAVDEHPPDQRDELWEAVLKFVKEFRAE